MIDTKFVSGFAGIGKSHLTKNFSGTISDSDSSLFDKSKFPENYLDHIESLDGKKDIVLISTHKEVRDGLNDRGIIYNLVYPSKDQIDEYVQRYIDRGSPESFIKLLKNNFVNWVEEIETQKMCNHIVLEKNQFLSDVIDLLV